MNKAGFYYSIVNLYYKNNVAFRSKAFIYSPGDTQAFISKGKVYSS